MQKLGYKYFCKRARCLRFARFSCNLHQIDWTPPDLLTGLGWATLDCPWWQTLGSLRPLTHSRSLALFCTLAFFLFRGFWKSLYIPPFTSYGTASSHLPPFSPCPPARPPSSVRLPLVTSSSRAFPSPICLCLSCSSRLEGSSARKFL